MQYGLIGTMLLRRGAHDEAAAGLPEGARALPERRRDPEEPRAVAARPEEPGRRDRGPEGRPADRRQPGPARRGAAGDGAAGGGRPHRRTGDRAGRPHTRPAGVLLSPHPRCRRGPSDAALAAVAPARGRCASPARTSPGPPATSSRSWRPSPRTRTRCAKMAEVREAEGNTRGGGRDPRSSLAGAAGSDAATRPRPSRSTGARRAPVADRGRGAGRVARLSPAEASAASAALRAGRRPIQELVVDIDVDDRPRPRSSAARGRPRVRRGGADRRSRASARPPRGSSTMPALRGAPVSGARSRRSRPSSSRPRSSRGTA